MRLTVLVSAAFWLIRAAADLNGTECNFVDVYPVDVCFIRRETPNDSPRSRKYVCIEEDGVMVPKRYTYKSTDNCTGEIDERDESDENYYCDADESCPYLRYQSKTYSDRNCDGDEPDLRTETILVIDHCVGEDNNTLYVCNEDEDDFYDCDCSGSCFEQNFLLLDQCGELGSFGSLINDLIECPATTQDVRFVTPSPIPSAGCNFIGTSPIDVCYEWSSQNNGIQSRKYECRDGVPYRIIYEEVKDCSGDPSETEIWDDVNYECEEETNCDYLRVINTVYNGDTECSTDVEGYISEDLRAIDACVGNGVVYECNSDGSNYNQCDCEEECELQTTEFGECTDLTIASRVSTLYKCGPFINSESPTDESGVFTCFPIGLALMLQFLFSILMVV